MNGYDGITSLEPLAGLTVIPGTVDLGNFNHLASLEGLHNLEHIGGALSLYNIPELVDLDGLRGLKRLDRNLELRKLPLVDLTGLVALTEVGAPGVFTSVSFDTMPQLTSLAGRSFAWLASHNVVLTGDHDHGPRRPRRRRRAALADRPR